MLIVHRFILKPVISKPRIISMPIARLNGTYQKIKNIALQVTTHTSSLRLKSSDISHYKIHKVTTKIHKGLHKPLQNT